MIFVGGAVLIVAAGLVVGCVAILAVEVTVSKVQYRIHQKLLKKISEMDLTRSPSD